MEEEQKGSQRAVYGKYQIPELSKYLTERIGRGFSVIGICWISWKVEVRCCLMEKVWYDCYMKRIGRAASREVFPTRFTESFFGVFNRYPHLILRILRIGV